MTPELDAALTWAAGVLMVVGSALSLGAAFGILRFPDLLTRMHAATKPQVLGSLMLLTAVGLQLRTWALVPVLVVAWIFQLLTVPVSAHMLGRSGYRTKHLDKARLSVDELEDVVARVERGGPDGTHGGGAADGAAGTGHDGGASPRA
ncbi:monovalent cation/H(+) antiporter subunit G [Sinomonas sp. R1AF57]|uniref:monovalent cation/H(+) antiporter subunit G n=1 Tax=Sinomonas sp. R1AF57 TaxID=2020377 RepID=UPI000B61AB43|nr:monovalent cation/H(+) antiporter subunit G [Sinomonas sp. R1AF57]ASN53092.1 sodium:proton antiporter [Sinomonas sp. R1AF57]